MCAIWFLVFLGGSCMGFCLAFCLFAWQMRRALRPLARAVIELLADPRSNSLVGNLLWRAQQKGNSHAQQDLRLLHAVVQAVHHVFAFLGEHVVSSAAGADVPLFCEQDRQLAEAFSSLEEKGAFNV